MLDIRKQGGRLVSLFSDREYYRRMAKIGLPIALQQFIMSSLNMVGVVMIGQLGETSVAAVGLANQIFFLLNLLLFGITSGSAIFTAQLWGKKDVLNIRRVLGLCLLLSLAGGGVFMFVSLAVPEAALGIYSTDAAVVALGRDYLLTFGWSFLFIPVTFSFAAVLRSTGDVRTPLVVSMTALSLNTALSYALIFGHLGLPEMGVQGAALAGLMARVLECTGMVFMAYQRRTPAAARLGELFRFERTFVATVMRRVLPVTLNELLWSLGITAYYVVYGRISTNALAAMNLASSVDNMALVVFIGIGNACAILVGNYIGAGEEENAHRYAGRSLALAMAGALLVGGVILGGMEVILGLYQVSAEVIEYTRRVLTIIALLLWLRMANLILFIGIFRSGGDTRFALLLDGVTIWVVGVPLAFLGGFVFHLPVYLVYLLVMAEEATKFFVGLARFISRRWIHNLARMVGELDSQAAGS